ncbi:glycoside hydrolase family 13 protein [Salsuginibacillus kocurii]|uniref:glycoside hydrolase family 13 protein n=1 Tax=Salsuginibacillus kocurii TaxID=427078 RepID=UPI00037C68BC|nr:alpha-glucosidase [Salsuginibacillus kocurii]
MTTEPWWKESVVYQIYPRSFNDSNGDGIGDIPGIIEKLDYLSTLGVDVIWLSPIYDSPNDDNGYDIRNYQAIMHEFGTMADFDELLEKAHAKGLKIVMDLVVNHTSDEHAWFMEAKQSKNSPKRDYYIWREGRNGAQPNNWASNFSGPAWEYDEQTDMYYLHLFSKKQPDLNWENPELRQDVYKMMKWWLDKGVAGFRMDVINLISKDQSFPDGELAEGEVYASPMPMTANGPRIHEFLREMNEQVLSQYDILTVGEMPGVDVEEVKRYTAAERNELHMVFHFEHMGLGDGPEGKWSALSWKLTELKKIMSKWQYGLEQEGWNSLYWNNHDQPRVVSRFGDDKTYRERSAKMLATCLHGMKGTPYIYQGEEIGMTNVAFSSIAEYEDIESINWYNEKRKQGVPEEELLQSIHARGRDNARTPMQWDDTLHAGFTKGTPWLAVNPNYKEINVKQALEQPNSIFYYYKQLIALRKTEETLVHGAYGLLLPEDEAVYAYTRKFNEDVLLVVCNFTAEEQRRNFNAELGERQARVIVSNLEQEEAQLLDEVVLAPYEAFIYRLQSS